VPCSEAQPLQMGHMDMVAKTHLLDMYEMMIIGISRSVFVAARTNKVLKSRVS
jgi:hypothetical protein